MIAKLSIIPKSLFCIFLLFCLSACNSTRELLDIDTSISMRIIASEDLNPDLEGRPSPIVISVFALSDDRQFKREDFLSLYENPADRLGSDLLDSYQLKEFSPGENRQEQITLKPETRYIGIMAAYAQYDQAKALLVLPITAHKTNKYQISAERLQILVANK